MSGEYLQTQNMDIGKEKDFNLVDFIRFVYSHVYFLLSLTFAIPSVVGIVTFFIKKPIYQATSSVNVTLNKKQNSLGFGGFTTWMRDQELITKLYFLEKYFYSDLFQIALVEEVDGKTSFCELDKCGRYKAVLKNYYGSEDDESIKSRGETLIGDLNIEIDDKKYSFTITGQSPNSEVAMAITNIATETLVGINFKNLLNNSSKVKSFLEEQTTSIKTKLTNLENDLVSLQTNNVYLGDPETHRLMSETYFQKRKSLDKLQVDFASTQLYIKELEHEIAYVKDQLSSDQPSYTYFSQLKDRYELLKYQKILIQNDKDRGVASSRFDEENEIGKFKKILKQKSAMTFDPWKYLEGLSEELNKNRNKLNQYLSGIKAYDKSILESNKQYRILPSVLRKFSELKRNIELTNELYSLLQKRYQETEIQEAGKTNDLNIMNFAEEPKVPTGISVFSKYVLSIVAAILIGIFLLFLYYIVMPTFSGVEEVEYFGLKVIGNFKAMKIGGSGLLDEKKYPLILKVNPNSYEANSIRYTRFKLETLLNIDLMSTERSAKVISMASVNKNEGKTFSASNLAYALSVTDNKVLIMDVDFSKPEQSKYFPDAVETPELEIVNSETRINFKRKKVSRNLHIIDTHRISENLCDYVESAVFKSFLEDLKSEYDIIIIDSPPINGHLEPFLLAQYSDFVIFVTNQRKTIKDDFKRALKTFRDTYNGPILGILNFTYDDLKGAIAERKDAA